MSQCRQANDPDLFLARVGREAADLPLRVLSLPGALVLLREGLSGPQRHRFLALLSREVAPPGLMAPGGRPAPTGMDREQGQAAGPSDGQGAGVGADNNCSEAGEGAEPASCQVTVEERQQLFSCFQFDHR